MEQGSYLLIQPGMAVQGNDGALGTVAEVVADSNIDVFRGIVLSKGLILHKESFVPAELVVGVVGNQVHVNISKEDVRNLQPVTAGGTDVQGKD